MTLKRSEVQDYSWRISTVLVSFLVSSPSCHAFLKLALHLLLDALVVNDEEDTSISSIRHEYFPGSTSVQVLFPIGTVLGEELAGSIFLWFCLIGMQNLSHPISTHILRADLREFLAHCCSNSSQPCLIHEWEILTQEWVLSLLQDIILTLHVYRANNWL